MDRSHGAGGVRGGTGDRGPADRDGWGHAVLVPVKAFRDAKVRLAPALPPEERAALAQAMGRRVIEAAAPLPVAVVCDDPEVASWARDLGALAIWEPGRGLNHAVGAGVASLARRGAGRVTVAHADLPLAAGLARVAGAATAGEIPGARRADDRVVLVPDRRRDGTNVVSVPTSRPFAFSYGPGSFRRHCARALALGLAVEVLSVPELAWDVDVPDDLTELPGLTALAGLPGFGGLPGFTGLSETSAR